MINVALVEDTSENAQIIKNFVKQYRKTCGEGIVLQWYQNGLDFLEQYDDSVDVVFMDIEMPHIDGIETARRLREIDPTVPLIFLTVMAQLAIKGYEVSAMDFMVKPVTYFNFVMKLEKAISNRRRNTKIVLNLLNDEGEKVHLISSDIFYIESCDHLCLFHTNKGDFHRHVSMSELEKTFETNHFLRCSSSFLINPAYVSKVNKESVEICSVEIPIARARKKEVMQQLTSYFKFVY